MATVYLLHFEPPYRHARHYLGAVEGVRLAERLAVHRAGRGASLTRAAIAAGCTLTLTRTWPDASFAREAQIKRQGGLSRVCPTCRALAALNRSGKHDTD